MQLPSKQEWLTAIHIIGIAGAMIYLGALTFMLILSEILGHAIYTPDFWTTTEIVLIPTIILILANVIIVEFRSLN